MTAAPEIDGESYLYAEVLTELNRVFIISLKYAVGLFPVCSENQLITILPGLNLRLAEDLYTALSIGYMISTDNRTELRQYIGARLCPIHSGNMGEISIELLPFSIFLDMESWRPVFMIELMSIAFWLPHKSQRRQRKPRENPISESSGISTWHVCASFPDFLFL